MAGYNAAAFDAFERDNWQRAAHHYVDGFARLSVHTVDPLLSAVGAGAGTRLLDVGCGPGVLSAVAVARGCDVSGVDVTEEMVAIARTAVPAGSFFQADVQSGLPFPDDSFDAVAGNMVVHHFGRPELALSALVRVLAVGGRLGLTMWDPPADNPALGIVGEAATAVGADEPQGIPVLPPRPDDEAFRQLFGAAGLRDVSVTHATFEFATDPEQWWHALVHSTALTAALVTHQPDDVQDRIKTAYDRQVLRYVDNTGLARFPASATLAVGTR